MLIKNLTTNDAIIKHQQILTEIMRPATHSLFNNLNVQEKSNVLCLNCGEGDSVFHLADLVGKNGLVIGVDPIVENIQTAQLLSQIKKLHNTDFCTIGQISQKRELSFNFIHCRLPLIRSFDIEIILGQIENQLIPGGVVVFDIINLSGFNSISKNFAFDRFLDIYTSFVRSTWGSTSFSSYLNQLLVQSGFNQVQQRYSAPTFLRNSSKTLPSLTLECILEEVLYKKQSSVDELQVLLYELKNFEQNNYSLISLPGFHQIWGYKSETKE